jgi:preprotein translocase subunit SecD
MNEHHKTKCAGSRQGERMQNRNFGWLIVVVIVALLAALVDAANVQYQRPQGLTGTDYTEPWWAKLLFWQPSNYRAVQVTEGLDLRGGLQVLLEADVPSNVAVSQADMQAAIEVIRNRIDALGVTEPLVQESGSRRIIVELPGISDPNLAISTIQQQAFLEFVDAGFTAIPDGTRIETSNPTTGAAPSTSTSPAPTPTPGALENGITPTPGITVTPSITGGALPTGTPSATLPSATSQPPITSTPAITTTPPITSGTEVTGTQTPTPTKVYNTVITGQDLASVQVTTGQLNQPEVAFTLKSSAADAFGKFTTEHNQATLGMPYYMCIVLDKVVISCPSIQNAIPGGQGVITLGNNATLADADRLAIQLRSGSLPIQLRVVQTSSVGPTLGQDSIHKSIIAGIIAMLIVVVFMLLYYRLPGALADAALVIFASVVFALYKLIPITLTLPGFAGLALAVGVAVDANILIFERMKEELRAGRRLDMAVEAGFDRAWPSIRDSNISTLITCLILFIFGSTYGASIVKGFALTLGLGVSVSLFTGIWVTRTFLRLVLPRLSMEHKAWFGV